MEDLNIRSSSFTYLDVHMPAHDTETSLETDPSAFGIDAHHHNHAWMLLQTFQKFEHLSGPGTTAEGSSSPNPGWPQKPQTFKANLLQRAFGGYPKKKTDSKMCLQLELFERAA